MRRRLLLSTLAVAVGVVLLLGIPLAIVVSRLVLDESARQLERDADNLATGLEYRLETGRPVDPAEIEKALPDRYIIIKQYGHQTQRIGRPPPPASLVRTDVVTENFSVTVEADGSIANGQVTDAVLLIGALAALAVGVVAGLAVIQVRRLTLPLLELAESAERLGLGDTRPPGRRYGVRELDQVAEGLDRSAERVADLLAAEREFAADASHQLRSPLTALSMRLEEMITSADDADVVREEGAAALAQTERLTDVVNHLLGRTRRNRGEHAVLVDVDEMVAQQVADWDPTFRRANRKLEVAGEKGLATVVTPGGLAQVIASLLENALVHGGGMVTIRTAATPKSIVIEVRDEGAGVPQELAPRIFERNVSGKPGGTGLGLALARAMADADGGRVALVRPRPPTFAVFLPRREEGDSDDPPVVTGPA